MTFNNTYILDCLYESDNEFEIPNLLIEKQAGKLELPLVEYGSRRRQAKAATIHFYVDDYRFENIWKRPHSIFSGCCTAIIEPNTSIAYTTPIAFGIHQIYKKRWIARFWQECGLLVYADLFVSPKFYQYNKMGIPKGYNAFATRGNKDEIDCLEAELEIAQDISGKEIPNLIVYGGGKNVQEFCRKHSLLYIFDLMTERNGEKRARSKDERSE